MTREQAIKARIRARAVAKMRAAREAKQAARRLSDEGYAELWQEFIRAEAAAFAHYKEVRDSGSEREVIAAYEEWRETIRNYRERGCTKLPTDAALVAVRGES